MSWHNSHLLFIFCLQEQKFIIKRSLKHNFITNNEKDDCIAFGFLSKWARSRSGSSVQFYHKSNDGRSVTGKLCTLGSGGHTGQCRLLCCQQRHWSPVPATSVVMFVLPFPKGGIWSCCTSFSLLNYATMCGDNERQR